MTKRMWMMLMMTLGFVGVLGAVKVLQIQAVVAQASSFQPPPEAVTTIVAQPGAVAGDAGARSARWRPCTA